MQQFIVRVLHAHSRETQKHSDWWWIQWASPLLEVRIRCIDAAWAKVRHPSARQLLAFITVSSRWQSRVTPIRSSREPRRSSWTSALGFFFFFFQLTSRKCETFVRNTYQLFLLGSAPSWILSATQSDPYRVESLSRTTASLSTVCACDIRKIPQLKALKARHQPWSLGPPAIFFVAPAFQIYRTLHRHLTPLIPLCDPSRGLCHL